MRFWTHFGLCVCLFFSANAQAQSHTEKRVFRGWTASGGELLVDHEHLGEIMVDDSAREFFFETTATYSARDGAIIHRYQRGTPSGAEHPDFMQARSAEQLSKLLENMGEIKAEETWLSPNQNWLLTSVESTKTNDDGRCELRQRVMLFNREKQIVYVVLDQTTRSDAGQREVGCPRVSLRAYWHPNSEQWILERLQIQPDPNWKLIPGRTDSLDQFAESGFIKNAFASQIWLNALPDDAIKTAWTHAFEGRPADGLSALLQDTSVSANKLLLMSLLFSLDGKPDGARKVLKDGAKQLKSNDPIQSGLQGAVWAAVGDRKQATTFVNTAIKQAKTYQELAQLGAIFTLVDLNVSNDIFIHALSHPTAVDQDTSLEYSALIDGLIEARQFEAAETLFTRLGTLNSAQKVLQASMWVAENRPTFAKPQIEAILLAEPGRCRAYAVSARLSVLDRRTADALEHFRAAAMCNPLLTDAAFFVADLELRRGNVTLGKAYLEKFLANTAQRRQDPVREVRLNFARQGLERLKNNGLVMLTASCFPTGQTSMCQGTLFNNSDETLKDIGIVVSSKDAKGKLKTLQNSTVDGLEPRQTRTVTLSVEGPAATISAGRDEAEHTKNRMDLIL